MTEQQGYDPDTAHRFTYHPPTPEQPEVYQLVRDVAHLFVILVEASTFPSRERSLALTKAEEAVMWANASIARRGLSDAAHAGARDLFDLALAELQKAKPDSAVIEDDGVHWSPVTAWERAAKDAHAHLAAEDISDGQRVFDALAVLEKLINADPGPEPGDAPEDPWPPDGHVTPTLEPKPAAYVVDVLRSGLTILTHHHGDAVAPAAENCPACWAQLILNGEPLPNHDPETRDPNEWTGLCPFCPPYIRTEGRGAQRDAQEWVLDHIEQAHGWNLR